MAIRVSEAPSGFWQSLCLELHFLTRWLENAKHHWYLAFWGLQVALDGGDDDYAKDGDDNDDGGHDDDDDDEADDKHADGDIYIYICQIYMPHTHINV